MWFAFAFAFVVLCLAVLCTYTYLLTQEKMNEQTSNNALEIMMANGESKLWHTAFSKKQHTRTSACVLLDAVIVHMWMCFIFLTKIHNAPEQGEGGGGEGKSREKNSNKSTTFLLFFLLWWAYPNINCCDSKKTARLKNARAVKLFQH